MNDQHIAQLEARLEKITEGLFAHLFGRRVQAHDIALQLVRAMENGLKSVHDGDSRPLAPDLYLIYVSPQVASQIGERYPSLPQVLSDQIINVAASAGYRLNSIPQIEIISVADFTPRHIEISAEHIIHKSSTTGAMQPINLASDHTLPRNPQLIISGQTVIPLGEAIVNIGRSRKNAIVLDDPYVSRTHAQIRLRFGHFMIFDASSQSGTFVNEVRIREHRLQSGDVIRVGKTSMVYMEDDSDPLTETGTLYIE